MYDPKDIIELIAANVRKAHNPFGVSSSVINTWWRDVPLERDGDAMLFTGLMYQSAPYIERATEYLARFEDTSRARYVRYGKHVPGYVTNLGFKYLASGQEKRKSCDIIRGIHKILVKSKVDFFYSPELDHYSGVLLYDLGDEEGFARHAVFVSKLLRERGVRKLITVDPHTTYAMKVLYPRYTKETFEVKTYFELADLRGCKAARECSDTHRVTLHDPCFYGRYLELSDVPQKVLQQLGIECVAVRNSGKLTHCCGGPAESISPKLTTEVLGRRIEELEAAGNPIIAMCPICLGNLRRAGVQAEDLSTLMARYT